MTEVINRIKEKSVPILKEAGVSKSAIFGSFVRGEQKKDSDIDMLIQPPKGMGLFALADLQMKLEDALGRKVDIVTYKSIYPELRESILKDQYQIL